MRLYKLSREFSVDIDYSPFILGMYVETLPWRVQVAFHWLLRLFHQSRGVEDVFVSFSLNVYDRPHVSHPMSSNAIPPSFS